MAKITPNTSAASTNASTSTAAPTAKDDGKTKKEKAPKTKRVEFANVGNADPKVFPFTVATPEGYNFDTNKRLKKKHFVKPSLYIDFLASEMEHKAKKLRERAELIRKEGDGAGVGRTTRLVKMMEKVNELKAVLAAQGIDVEALLSSTKPAAAPAAEAAPSTVKSSKK